MKQIQLTRNLFTLIDDKNYNMISQNQWYAKKCGKRFYAARLSKTIYMHKIILENKLNRKIKKYEEIHHINENSLDNRECNLRVVTRAQHIQLKRKQKIYNGRLTSSEYKGVYWNKRKKKWHAQIRVKGKNMHLGYFNNETEAAKAYDKIAIKYFKEFIYLNFPIKEII